MYGRLSLYQDELSLTLSMVLDWSSDFYFSNRLPYLLPALSSTEVGGSHVPYRPYRFMGSPLTRIMHRTFCLCRTRKRAILWNHYFWLLVLDLAQVPNRTIYHGLPLHGHLGYILLHPLRAHIFPTTRQY